MSRLVAFVKARARGVRKRLEISWIKKWLSTEEKVFPVSAITPPQNQSLPEVDSYRGLEAVIEMASTNASEWYFVWRDSPSATVHEAKLKAMANSGSVTNRFINDVRTRKAPWWKRISQLSVLLVVLAALIHGLENLDQIYDFWNKYQHKPEFSLESTKPLQIASGRTEFREIVLRGDPFFRAQLKDVYMEIVPDPQDPGAKSLPNNGRLSFPSGPRSADIGGETKLEIPFNNIPAGRYLVKLRGKTSTTWRDGEFAPQPLRLDARNPFGIQKIKVTPWPPGPHADGKFPEAIVEIHLTFGAVTDKTANIRVVLEGSWVNWKLVDNLPQGMLEKLSQNSATSPKSIIFGLRGFPAESFKGKSIQLHVWPMHPLTEPEWQHAVTDLYVDNLE